jgi:hypothetical protein
MIKQNGWMCRSNKQQQMNWQQIWLKTDALNMNNSEGRIVTVLYLQGLNILWLPNWQLQPYLPRCCYEAPDVMLTVSLLFQRAHLWPLEKQEYPSADLLLHTNCPSAVPVKFHNYNDSVTRVARRLQVPTMPSRDILLQAKEIILIESTQIRWFSRWLGRGGESGRAMVSVGQESPN